MKAPIEQLIVYIDIFLLAFAIGINCHAVYGWYNAPVSYDESEKCVT